jgi:hypothetical protein
MTIIIAGCGIKEELTDSYGYVYSNEDKLNIVKVKLDGDKVTAILMKYNKNEEEVSKEIITGHLNGRQISFFGDILENAYINENKLIIEDKSGKEVLIYTGYSKERIDKEINSFKNKNSSVDKNENTNEDSDTSNITDEQNTEVENEAIDRLIQEIFNTNQQIEMLEKEYIDIKMRIELKGSNFDNQLEELKKTNISSVDKECPNPVTEEEKIYCYTEDSYELIVDGSYGFIEKSKELKQLVDKFKSDAEYVIKEKEKIEKGDDELKLRLGQISNRLDSINFENDLLKIEEIKNNALQKYEQTF